MLLGAALLAPVASLRGAAVVAFLAWSMFAIDTWANPAHLRELAIWRHRQTAAGWINGLSARTLALPIFWFLTGPLNLVSRPPALSAIAGFFEMAHHATYNFLAHRLSTH